MARPKKNTKSKAAKKVGGVRKSAGRKSVEVHFAALEEKLAAYHSDLEKMFNVFHGEIVTVNSTLTQMGQLLFGQRPVAPQVQAPSVPALVAVPPQATAQNGDQSAFQIRFQPPTRPQVDAHGNPIQQS